MAKYLTEAIGTFFLVLTIGMTGGNDLAPLAIGAALMVMIFMGGHISGAHYNPAVSLGVFLRGKLDVRDLVLYIASQLVGAILAAHAVFVLKQSAMVVAPAANASVFQSLLAEVLFTFALVLVVLNVATAKKTQNNSFYGLAIGFTVLAGAFSVGGISGGAFNPAVGTGPAIVAAFVGYRNPVGEDIKGLEALVNVWLYIIGPCAGGALAAMVFLLQEKEA